MMLRPLDMIGKAKLQEILREISRIFHVSATLLDATGAVFCRSGIGEDAYRPNKPEGGERTTVPIRLMNNIIASLEVEHGQSPDGTAAGAAAYCLENLLRYEAEIADLSGEVVRVYEELSLMYSITNKLGSEMDVDTICRRALEETGNFLEVHNLSIMLLDAEGRKLHTKLSLGRDAVAAATFATDITSGFWGHVLHQGTPVTICDITRDVAISFPYPATSILLVPMITDDRAIGLIMAADKLSRHEFWSRELKLMGMFATEIAASIRKAQLYHEINTTFVSTVEAFASAIDAKDPYTYGHSRRVALISVAICEDLGIPASRTRMLELAALLHDIGKIGTPESILQKPGRLMQEEFEKIKEHPGKGAEILSGIREFSQIITWIRHHHEWYNGQGYPGGIAAEEIPLEARIITIADAYDAMTSDRPYRKGMPLPDVIEIMEESTRSQFDPDIFKAFKRVIDNGKIDFMEKKAFPPEGGEAAPCEFCRQAG